MMGSVWLRMGATQEHIQPFINAKAVKLTTAGNSQFVVLHSTYPSSIVVI